MGEWQTKLAEDIVGVASRRDVFVVANMAEPSRGSLKPTISIYVRNVVIFYFYY